jgi:hypothetical protein
MHNWIKNPLYVQNPENPRKPRKPRHKHSKTQFKVDNLHNLPNSNLPFLYDQILIEADASSAEQTDQILIDNDKPFHDKVTSRSVSSNVFDDYYNTSIDFKDNLTALELIAYHYSTRLN